MDLTWVGKSMHIQLENLKPKEAELVLVGKAIWVALLLIQRLRSQTSK